MTQHNNQHPRDIEWKYYLSGPYLHYGENYTSDVINNFPKYFRMKQNRFVLQLQCKFVKMCLRNSTKMLLSSPDMTTVN